MERTRDEVVRLLHEDGPSSAASLAERIGVSEGAIRRHMDIMLGEGLVQTELERHGRGRPSIRYSLTEAGEERSAAAHYQRLLDRIFPALANLPREAVSGANGATVVERVFESMAADVAREYSPRVTSALLDERVQQVARALEDEGILTEVVDEGDCFRLLNVGCPYRSAAEEHHAACEADRLTIQLLLDAPVEQVATAVGGSSTCQYLVSKPGAAAGEPIQWTNLDVPPLAHEDERGTESNVLS
ncbi:MAG: ArsR family transcriptional regulator [Dehalococcoidia bacterium]